MTAADAQLFDLLGAILQLQLMREMMRRSLHNILLMLSLLVILGAAKMGVAAHPGMSQVGFAPGVSRMRSGGGFATSSSASRRRTELGGLIWEKLFPCDSRGARSV